LVFFHLKIGKENYVFQILDLIFIQQKVKNKIKTTFSC